MKFKISKEYYDGIKLYKKVNIEFNKGVTVLIGCNGIGKTTLLNEIAEICENKDIPYISLDKNDLNERTMSKYLIRQSYDIVATLFEASEGEKVSINLNVFLGSIREKILKHKNEEMFILLDSTDSGLDDYSIDELKGTFELILQDCPNAYIIVSSNNYAYTIDEPCFQLPDCKYVNINSYDDYKKYIVKSYEYKMERG